jgi:predicted Rdx family selenoprotein
MDATATETIAQQPAAVGAATMAQAFRMTAAERAGEVAIRTKGDEFSITCASAWTRSRAAWRSSASGAATRSR